MFSRLQRLIVVVVVAGITAYVLSTRFSGQQDASSHMLPILTGFCADVHELKNSVSQLATAAEYCFNAKDGLSSSTLALLGSSLVVHIEAARLDLSGCYDHLQTLREHTGNIVWVNLRQQQPSLATTIPSLATAVKVVVSTKAAFHDALLQSIDHPRSSKYIELETIPSQTRAPFLPLPVLMQQPHLTSMNLEYRTHSHLQLPPLQPTRKQFVRYQNQDSPEGTMAIFPTNNVSELASLCDKYLQCVAFSTNGHLKVSIASGVTLVESEHDLYVAVNIDVCQLALHKCHGKATCISSTPMSHTCTCQTGYAGDGCRCTALHNDRQSLQLELEDELDRPPISTFTFVPHMDSPFSDLLVVPQATREQLEGICGQHPRCMAFNTNGVLKSQVQDPSSWYTFSSNDAHGLYVRDIDYCVFQGQGCPDHAKCVQLSVGTYGCQCNFGYDWERHTEEAFQTCKKIDPSLQEVHVAFAVDRTQMQGIFVAIKSLQRACQHPELLRIWVFSNIPTLEDLLQAQQLRTASKPGSSVIGLVHFQLPDWLKRSIKVDADPRTHGKLKSEANFVRFLFPELLSDVKRLLYLDVDIVVQKDIRLLYTTPLEEGDVLGAVERPIALHRFFNSSVSEVFKARYGRSINLDQSSFNAGVLLLDLDAWRACKATNELRFWMEERLKTPLWQLGTQPPILLLSYGRWTSLQPTWNVDGIGYRGDLTEDIIKEAGILHWTGSNKPWHNSTLWSAIWRGQLRHV
eukprot:m.249139 g.249139  ORF g.249139 m.249139 type:complete len:745 (+) comp17509_c1_seq1:2546-4780(+)